MEFCKPNQEYWKYMDAAWLVDICGLVAGIDLSAYRIRDARYSEDKREEVNVEYHQFMDKHESMLVEAGKIRRIAESALRGGSLKMTGIDPRNGHPIIKLSEFRRWANSIGLNLPPEFPCNKATEQEQVLQKEAFIIDEETRKALEACELAERRDKHREEQKKRIRPNWDKWKYCEELYLVQAAWLSFDIDPDYFNLERPADIEISMRNLGFSLLEILEIRKKWNDLIYIAICAIKNEPPLLQYVRYKDDGGYVVKNYNFAKWLKSIGRTLPPEFPTGTSTDAHQQDAVTVTALKDIPTAIKTAKSEETTKKMLKAAQAFHDDNGRYPDGRELFSMGKDAHGYGDWETFRKTFFRYFSEAG